MTQMNIQLFIFALMIQTCIAAVVLLLPASATAAFPAYANPQSVLTAAYPSDNFGYEDVLDLASSVGCSADVLYLNCIAEFFIYVLGAIGILFNIAVYIGGLLITLIIFFIGSGFGLTSTFPSWFALPINVFLLAVNIIIIFDLILVMRGVYNVFS